MKNNTPTYKRKRHFTVSDRISCVIPDGYRHGANDGSNARWSYVVPEDAEKGILHTYAQPFNFAITCQAINPTPVSASMVPQVELLFKQKGFLDKFLETRRVVTNTDDVYCVYQAVADENDYECLCAKGFLLSEIGIYQFHAFYYPEPNTDLYSDETIDYFFDVVEEWLKQIKLS